MNNNAIEYGSTREEINFLRVMIYDIRGVKELIIEVEDTGNGTKHKKALEMETLRAHQLKLGYT